MHGQYCNNIQFVLVTFFGQLEKKLGQQSDIEVCTKGYKGNLGVKYFLVSSLYV